MADCKESIESYLISQEHIKNTMKHLSKECPDKVLKFMLTAESQETFNKLTNCTFSDSLNKKYFKKLIINSCYKLN